jgi:hypothetical protein
MRGAQTIPQMSTLRNVIKNTSKYCPKYRIQLDNVSGIRYNTGMNKIWNEYTWVCDTCDALYKITSYQEIPPCFQGGCQSKDCNGYLQLVSVVDVTIAQSTDDEEDEEKSMNNESFTLIDTEALKESIKQELELTYGNEITELKNYLDVKNGLISRDFKRVQELKQLIEEEYEESEDRDTLMKIAKIFNIELTKEVSWSAVISVWGTTQVDLTEGDYNINDIIVEELSVDSRGNVNISDFEVDSVEESE